jgi:hypothetical protein
MQNMMLRMRKVKVQLHCFVKRFSSGPSMGYVAPNRDVLTFALHSDHRATMTGRSRSINQIGTNVGENQLPICARFKAGESRAWYRSR